MNENDPFLTRKEAAQVLRACGLPIAAATLAALVTRGGGPAFLKFGQRALYRRSDLVAWAHARLNPATGPAEGEATM